MKNTFKKISSVSLAAILCAVLCVSAFASAQTEKITGLQNYLKSVENTEFDFSQTDFADSDIDWTVFALARSGVSAYSEYADYIHTVVAGCFDSLYPSDLARIVLAVSAYGLDPTNIGTHDLIAALESVDYSAQTYTSSLVYPLLALNYNGEAPADETLAQSVVAAILSFQQPDGGFPYSSVDSGWGISSDIDTTSMTVQALARYYNTDIAVKAAVDKALAYMKTQQYSDGSFGYTAYNSKSGESTAQAILALCALGIDPTDSEFVREDGNPVGALADFIDSSTGAGLDYAMTANTMTSYQLLMGYTAFERFSQQMNGVYEADAAEEAPSNPTENTTADGAQPTTAQDGELITDVDIPKTGGHGTAIYSLATLLLVGGIGCCLRKKAV